MRGVAVRASDAGVQFVADEEGYVGTVYRDIAGHETIGYGHRLRPGEVYTALTRDEALLLMRADIRTAEAAVDRCVRVPLTQGQYDALVSFAFNLGGGALASSTLLRMLNTRDYEGAAGQFGRWCKARIGGVLTTSAVLLRRRRREAAMFRGPEEPEAA